MNERLVLKSARIIYSVQHVNLRPIGLDQIPTVQPEPPSRLMVQMSNPCRRADPDCQVACGCHLSPNDGHSLA